ncbi:ABC transporter permease subunit [bacterium]|nr:ABC transporter permease subunit [bacterium]
MSDRARDIDTLYRQRPRSRFLRGSGWLAAGLVAAGWLGGGFLGDPGWTPRRAENLTRFLGEVVPYPLQGEPWDWTVAVGWAREIWNERLAAATLETLAISVLAILLAGMLGGLLAPWATRSFARPDPFVPDPRPAGPARRAAWNLLVVVVRVVLALLRAIPEYVWAFLLLALFGPTAWPLVLALALHNAGILGKLTADMVENLERSTLAALRGLGAGRGAVALAGIVPLSMNRFLLYLFYRWETCVREATVLGMLGMVSLGYWIRDARARNHYDEMVLAMLCGATLVIVGDLVSAMLRELVRRA